MKYLKLRHLGFVIFEEAQDHSEIAKALGAEVESAGFVHATDWCDDGKIVCSGESQTLCKRAADGDTETLRRRFSR